MAILTIEDMTIKFGVDQRTLYTWRKQEGLPFIKVGKQIYFREESVNKWLLEKETKEQ